MATICKTYQGRIEQEVWEPIDAWIEKTERRCREYDWWNPIGWVHTTFHEPIRNPPENALRLGTDVDLILDEAWL